MTGHREHAVCVPHSATSSFMWFVLYSSVLCSDVLGSSLSVSRAVTQGCCTDRTLTIGFFLESYPPWWIVDRSLNLYDTVPSGTSAISGHIPIVIERTMVTMGLKYQYYMLPNPSLKVSSIEKMLLIGQLLELLENKTIDALLVSGVAQETYGADSIGGRYAYTHPLYSSSIGGLVLKTKNQKNMMSFMLPFTWTMWAAVVAFLFLTGWVLVAIQFLDTEHTGMSEHEEAARQAVLDGDSSQAGTVMAQGTYHSLAAYLGGDDYGWVTAPERMLRVGLLFFVLIVVSTYTANLASFFTEVEYTVHGPQEMGDLKDFTVCTATLPDLFEDGTLVRQSDLRPYAKDVIFPPDVACQQWNDCGRAYCHQALVEKRAGIWLDNVDGLHLYNNRALQCSGVSEVESIEFLQAVTVSMLAFPFSEWLFAANFSSALTFHEAQPSHLDQLTISFARGVDCTNSEDDDSTVQITLGDMSGLFIACFVLLGTSVPVALFQRHRRGLDDVTKPKGLNVEA
mmetsp:Transcript_21430/g.40822  ORF Transcript_21430/g.40822 Transcript_21430/m.40822 type:complete len:510 (+) Transcript_21430:65-1594(+)